MHPRTQELVAYLRVRRAALAEAVDIVPAPRRGDRPDADRWSVAEVLEHLALVEGRFQQTLAERLADAKAGGLGTEQATSSVVGTFDVAGTLDRTTKRQAPEPMRPQGVDWQAAWGRLEETRRSFLEVFIAGDGLALADVVHAHPRFGPLNLYQWGVWLGAHEARHTEQVREIGVQLHALDNP